MRRILTRPAGPVSFTFLLDVSGGTQLTQLPDSSVSAVDGAGKRRFTIPTPLLMEPSGTGGMATQSAAVVVAMSGTGGHYRLTYTPDMAWLTDPKRLASRSATGRRCRYDPGYRRWRDLSASVRVY